MPVNTRYIIFVACCHQRYIHCFVKTIYNWIALCQKLPGRWSVLWQFCLLKSLFVFSIIDEKREEGFVVLNFVVLLSHRTMLMLFDRTVLLPRSVVTAPYIELTQYVWVVYREIRKTRVCRSQRVLTSCDEFWRAVTSCDKLASTKLARVFIISR